MPRFCCSRPHPAPVRGFVCASYLDNIRRHSPNAMAVTAITQACDLRQPTRASARKFELSDEPRPRILHYDLVRSSPDRSRGASRLAGTLCRTPGSRAGLAVEPSIYVNLLITLLCRHWRNVGYTFILPPDSIEFLNRKCCLPKSYLRIADHPGRTRTMPPIDDLLPPSCAAILGPGES
jgi:hypothetical protein